MVGQQHVQVEWQNPHTEGPHRSGNRFRCIPGGIGGLLLQTENRGTMVSEGNICTSIASNYLQQLLRPKPLQNPRPRYLPC